MDQWQTAARGPLHGVRVLDLSRVVAGNALTGHLADFGADVIKVEPPKTGDDLRNWRVKGISTYWKVYCRNKRSVTLNLRDARARDILLRLVEGAAMLVENYRPGRLEEMGLGPDVLLARNPKLVVARISGWGQTGPWSHKPGFGSLVEGASGFAAMNGFPDRPPVLPPLALADQIAGAYGAAAALVALREVEVKGGRGQVIDLPLYEPMFAVLGPNAANYRLTGEVPRRQGSSAPNTAPRNVYQTRDGRWVAMSASTQKMAERVLTTIGRADMLADERFATNSERIRHRDELDGVVGGGIGARTLDENLAAFEQAEVTVGPVFDISDLIDHPFVRGRGVLVDLPDDEMGSLPVHAVSPRLSGTPGSLRRPAPKLGEHNAEVLAELGLDEAEVARLAEAGTL